MKLGFPFCAGVIAAGLSVGCVGQVDPQDDEKIEGAVPAPIIGGSAATAYTEAALIDMYRNGRVAAACSGAVIAPRVALTAGHCVAGFTSWRVRTPYAQNQVANASSADLLDWRDDGSGSVDPNLHDVGLLYLDTPVNLAQYPALADRALANGSSVVNIGRINNGRISNTALYVSKPLTVKSAASQGFPYDYIANEVIEHGDSGGPVEIPAGSGQHTLVAVNSGGGGGTEVLARVDLVKSWIAGKIAAHGGDGGGDTTVPPTPPPPMMPPPSGCSGPSEAEPNDDYRSPNALGASVCGTLGGADDQDWFGWSISGILPYSLKLTTTGDATISMWKLVNGSYSAVANTSATEISHTASAAGSYVVAIHSASGAAQSYKLTLTK